MTIIHEKWDKSKMYIYQGAYAQNFLSDFCKNMKWTYYKTASSVNIQVFSTDSES